jgi:UDP-GlcNAc:undecaprenyl-phosphate GlcNAc-1-phosphate transferase
MTMLPTYYNWRSPSATVLPVFTPLLLLSVPLFDTISVIIIRIKKKQSIFRGDTNHLSHRLVRLGFSPVQTIFFIYSMCLTIGAGTLLLPRLDLLGAGLIFFQALCLLVMVAVIERTVSARNGKE